MYPNGFYPTIWGWLSGLSRGPLPVCEPGELQPQSGPGMQRQPEAVGVIKPGDIESDVYYVTTGVPPYSQMPNSPPLQEVMFLELF